MSILIPVFVMNSTLVIITILLIYAESKLISHEECKIIVNKEKEMLVSSGVTLLNYFNEQHIFLPSACGGKATCGHCKVRVLSGAGDILPTEEVYLNQEEKKQGWRLACQVKVKGEIELFIPEYLLSAKLFKAEVAEITGVTHDIKYIKLRLLSPPEINFKPGQYMQIQIPGVEEFRAYSIASPPREKNILEFSWIPFRWERMIWTRSWTFFGNRLNGIFFSTILHPTAFSSF